MSMLSPLKPGDTIGVMAPSSWVEKDGIEKSKAELEKRGYKVFIHPQTFERDHQSAGTPLQKTLALQGLWQRDDIKAIWCAGGGNRALMVLDSINFDAMKKKPKIFIGFSDITVLLNGITVNTGCPTFHGPVFKNAHACDQLDHLLDLLAGKEPEYPWNHIQVVHDGRAEGKMFGGNLSLFQYLPQTLPGEFWKDSILFLEDCAEELSRIDRMLLHLRRLGVLKAASGLVFGEFTDMKDTGKPFEWTIGDIIREHTEGLDIPVVMNAPFGHGKNLYATPIGTRMVLDTTKRRLTFSEKIFTEK